VSPGTSHGHGLHIETEISLPFRECTMGGGGYKCKRPQLGGITQITIVPHKAEHGNDT
jgi:hypothetical protein